ncbi:MAG TPA: energy transducer TonB [Gammaproteobacteria bacterium]|nr:energy transducer TonB [Gammaproteobacteria bacterium]
MALAVPRPLGPLDLGGVVLLHLVVLAALLVVRIEPAPLSATAPIMAQIVQAPMAAPAAPRAQQPKHAPPLAMRTLPRKPRPIPVQEAPQLTKTKVTPLTSSTPRAAREVATAQPKRAATPPPKPAPTPKPLPRVAPPPPPAAVEHAPPAPPAPARAAASSPAVATSAAATAPTAAPERTAGSTGSPQDNRAYFTALLQQLNRFKVYPPALRKAKIEGRVVLKFTIDARGRVTFSDVQKTSGHAALDDAAERMLARASPLPAIPPSMGKTSLTLSVPIEYSLLTDR